MFGNFCCLQQHDIGSLLSARKDNATNCIALPGNVNPTIRSAIIKKSGHVIDNVKKKNARQRELSHFREEASDFRRGTSGTREIHCKPYRYIQVPRAEFIPFVGTDRQANRKRALEKCGSLFPRPQSYMYNYLKKKFKTDQAVWNRIS